MQKTPAPPQVQAPTPAPAAATPQTVADIGALRARQNELNNQRQALEARRARLSQEYRRTGDAGLRERMDVIDKELLQNENDLAQTGRLIANAPPGALQSIAQIPPYIPRSRGPDPVAILGVIFTAIVLAPLAFAWARRIWHRGTAAPLPPAWNETPQRLERLEHAVDSIAIEVERISESQRFMTRLFTEKAAAEQQPSAARALGAGEAPFEPVRAAERAKVPLKQEA